MTISQRTRASEVPIYEIAHDGCARFAESCLVCPLPKCYYGDMTTAEQAEVRMGERVTVKEVMNALGDGLTHVQISASFQISESTIARMLRRDKVEG